MAQELQFKKVTALPAKGKYAAGTIYFNDTTHSIFVAKSINDVDEFGGRIKDVTYEKGVLTIIKYTEDSTGSITYTLDFNDVASAEDVNKVLSGLYTRVGTLETLTTQHTTDITNLQKTLNGGTGEQSLVTRITNAETDIDALQKTVDGYTDSNNKKVDGLVTKVATNTNNISNLTTTVASKANDTGDASKQFNVNDPISETHAANKKYVDTLVSSAYKIRGCVDTKANLTAITGQVNGDVYNVSGAVEITADDVATGKFLEKSIGTYAAGTNWVWVAHANNTPHASHWDALGGIFDLSSYATTSTVAGVASRVTKLENGENTVKTFGGKYGDILIDTAPSKNGQITFAIGSDKKLSGSVKGIAAAAYKGVDTSVPESSTSVNLPTTKAVAAALTSLHSDIASEMKSNTVIAWAEWPTS